MVNREEFFLQQYRRFIDRQKKLSASEEREIVHEYREGNEYIISRLINSNLYLVLRQVWRHLDCPLSVWDLIQYGNEALVEAAREYNPDSKYIFKSFTMLRLFAYLKNAVGDNSNTMRIPQNIYDVFEYINLRRDELQDGYDQYCDEIFEYMDIDITQDEISQYLNIPSIRLNTDTYDRVLYVSDLTHNSLKDEILSLICKLPRRSAEMIDLYFGISNDYPLTLEEVGERYGLTRERVRQINNRSTQNLKEWCYTHDITNLFDSQYYEELIPLYHKETQLYHDYNYIRRIKYGYRNKRELFKRIFGDLLETKWQYTGLSTNVFIKTLSEDAQNYLESEGEPQQYSSIYNELALRYDDFPKLSLSKALKQNDNIIQINRGLYALRDWGYVPYFVEVKSYEINAEEGVLSVLEKADQPLDLKEIVNAIEEYYKGQCSTNRRTINAALKRINIINKDIMGRYYIDKRGMNSTTKIPVIFDKSHITTLGKKMYSKSIDLIRELVNNGYDADAVNVNIYLMKNKIIVEDDGSGMNKNGLYQYFTIGSKAKTQNNISPKFKRRRIGELGIGKFSSLGAATKFEVETWKGEFKGRVIFDQSEWDKDDDDWSVPLIEELNETNKSGTRVTLYDVEQQFSPQEVADRLRTSVPLDEKNFRVFVNDVEVKKVFIHGKRFKVYINTKYGSISGSIIIADKPQPLKNAGIECQVKNVMITKSMFGYDGFGHGINRIAGHVNADFLPFNSARDNFLVDTDEYRVFYKLMRDEVSKAVKLLKTQESDKLLKQSAEALKKASKLIDKAFRDNPDLTPISKIHVTESHKDSEKLIEDESTPWQIKKRMGRKKKTTERTKRDEYNIPHVNPITENKILKKVRSDLGIKYGFVNEGYEGVASYFLNDTIWVNREHKLYRYHSKNQDNEINYLVRILIAEAVIMLKPADLRQAHDYQIKLLSSIYTKNDK